MTRTSKFWMALAAAGLWVLPNLASAQLIGDPRSPLMAQSRSLAEERQQLVVDVEDPAFDVYVRPELIGRAYANVDSALLTDVALQLADGERVLLRSRNGITAAQALQLAVKAASDKQDKASLDRLTRFADQRGDKQLATQIAAAAKLAAVSRDASPKLMVPIEDIDLDQYDRMRSCIEHINRARLTSDSRCLILLDKDVDSCIPVPYQDQVHKLIDDARASIPDGFEADDQLIGVLSRLAAPSRWGPDDVGPPPPDDDGLESTDVPAQTSGAF